MKDSYKRGFSRGWRDHRAGNPPKTDFSKNPSDYSDGYREGLSQSDHELKRHGRDLAHQDFQMGVFDQHCNTPGYQEHHLKLREQTGRSKARFDLWNGTQDPDCNLPGYRQYLQEHQQLTSGTANGN